MPAYLVKCDPSAAAPRFEGVDTIVVFAGSAAIARQMAAAKWDGDSDALWAAATVIEIVVGADWEGWRFRAVLSAPGGAVVADASYVADDEDSIDDIGDALVAALGAASEAITPEYNDTTNVLSVAVAGDGLGDHTLGFSLQPPADFHLGSTSIAGLHGAIVHQGATGAAVTVALPADAAVIPSIAAMGKRS